MRGHFLTEVVHGEHVHGAAEHAHGRNGGAKQPRTAPLPHPGVAAQMVGGDHGHAHRQAWDHRALHAHRDPRDDVRSVAGRARLGDAPYRGVRVVGVVLPIIGGFC